MLAVTADRVLRLSTVLYVLSCIPSKAVVVTLSIIAVAACLAFFFSRCFSRRSVHRQRKVDANVAAAMTAERARLKKKSEATAAEAVNGLRDLVGKWPSPTATAPSAASPSLGSTASPMAAPELSAASPSLGSTHAMKVRQSFACNLQRGWNQAAVEAELTAAAAEAERRARAEGRLRAEAEEYVAELLAADESERKAAAAAEAERRAVAATESARAVLREAKILSAASAAAKAERARLKKDAMEAEGARRKLRADIAARRAAAARRADAQEAGSMAPWGKLSGGDLKPVLASGAVALLDALWIVKHAEAGGFLTSCDKWRLNYRQVGGYVFPGINTMVSEEGWPTVPYLTPQKVRTQRCRGAAPKRLLPRTAGEAHL